ncbi:MAG TPA: serine/threonine-protein kinase [Thermoleophilaceae bacterium]
MTPTFTQTVGGRYRVVRRLGAGGMATVFLAEDERLGRQVAVKRLHGESTEEVARRFRREARLGAALNHPNVVAVYDITADDEGVLIVMEYVEGQTLRDEIGDGPLPPERAIAILRCIAKALDYAHENGVVHRDVKPANVLIRRDGVVKLADLGIATAAEQSKITRSGSVLGTAAYMAPERLDGRPGGPAVDVYALAAVAFEMLCGRKAYEGNTPLEVAHKVVNEPTPDLRRCVESAPEPLAEALKLGLAWEPDARPARAGDLVAAIEAALPEAAASAAVEPSADAPAAHVFAPEAEAASASADGGSEEQGTPVRVLPPERTRTRPARTAAAAAPAAPAPTTAPAAQPAPTPDVGQVRGQIRPKDGPVGERGAETSAAGGSAGRPERGRRLGLPVIGAALASVALLVILIVALAGGGSGDTEGDRVDKGDTKGATAEKGSSGDESSNGENGSSGAQGSNGEGSTGSEGGSGGSAPADTGSGGGSTPAAGTAAAAVNDFYQRAARGDYAGAWALATPRAQEKLGGFSSFSAGQSTLDTISFPKLQGKESGDTATVTLQSRAVHRDRIDRCRGSVDLVRSGGAWKLDDFHIATCAKSPRP